IARALVTHPRLLLLDEPFASLDEITRFKLDNDLLALWARQRWTVVFVTHSVYESVYLSTRIAVMTARPGRTASEVAIEAPTPRRDGGTLSPSLLVTLTITGAALLVATVAGVLIAILFTQSKLIELSLFPYAVILQVTPVVAIAPLIIIWVKNIPVALLICAW